MTNINCTPLHNTEPLTSDVDLAAQMVEALDKYVTRAIKAATEKRGSLAKGLQFRDSICRIS